MGNYMLLKKLDQPGFGNKVYVIEKELESIEAVKEELKKRVKDGCPISKLRIARDIPFEFKCAIKLEDEEEV